LPKYTLGFSLGAVTVTGFFLNASPTTWNLNSFAIIVLDFGLITNLFAYFSFVFVSSLLMMLQNYNILQLKQNNNNQKDLFIYIFVDICHFYVSFPCFMAFSCFCVMWKRSLSLTCSAGRHPPSGRSVCHWRWRGPLGRHHWQHRRRRRRSQDTVDALASGIPWPEALVRP